MTEHERDELEEARHQELVEKLDQLKREQREGLEGFRQQQSAEHGTLFSKLTYITELMIWIKVRWEKFTRSGTWPGDSK